jgi:hypothetical protein
MGILTFQLRVKIEEVRSHGISKFGKGEIEDITKNITGT